MYATIEGKSLPITKNLILFINVLVCKSFQDEIIPDGLCLVGSATGKHMDLREPIEKPSVSYNTCKT